MLKIYGESDDLIEIGGDDRDEIGAFDTTKYLHFDTGHTLKVWYGDDGIWKIEEVRSGIGICTIEKCDDDNADPHSDVAIVWDAKKWCATTKPDGPSDGDVRSWFDAMRNADYDERYAMYMAAHPIVASLKPLEAPHA